MPDLSSDIISTLQPRLSELTRFCLRTNERDAIVFSSSHPLKYSYYITLKTPWYRILYLTELTYNWLKISYIVLSNTSSRKTRSVTRRI